MKTTKTIKIIALILASISFLGCINAEPLPTRPNEQNITLSTHVQDWRNEVIYQVLTDRFHDGDLNNNFNVDKRAMGKYQGGDWQGIIDKLDYLQSLGVTALWISPVVKNVETDAGFASYHGYWTQDFLKHNPHFGNLKDLRRLSDELHKRNMKLILDIVTNHVGQLFYYDINMNGQPDEWLAGGGVPMQGSGKNTPTPLSRVTEYDPDWDPRTIQSFTSLGIAGPAPIVFFEYPEINRMPPGPQNFDLNDDGKITGTEVLGFANPSWYHKMGRVSSWDDQLAPNGSKLSPPFTHKIMIDGVPSYVDGVERQYFQNDQTLFGDFPGGLKDVATEREDVRKAMIKVFSYWIDATDCDGFRIDTLKHVEYSFWEEFAPAIREHAAKRGKRNFFMFGEAFTGDDTILSAYTEPNQVDSVFLFSQKYAIDHVFKCPPGNTAPYCNGRKNGTSDLFGWDSSNGRSSRLERFNKIPQPNGIIDEAGEGVSPQQSLVNFLDNHDVARYLFDRNDPKGIPSLQNALTYLLTTHGIPCIYYGTEQAFFGGNDPANRENMNDPKASFYTTPNADITYEYKPWDTSNPLFKHIQKMIQIRKKLPPLTKGSFEFLWHSTRSENQADAGIFAFKREYNNEALIVVFNTNETHAKKTINEQEANKTLATPFPANTNLVDYLDPNYSVTTDASKNVIIEVPPMSARIMVTAEFQQQYQ